MDVINQNLFMNNLFFNLIVTETDQVFLKEETIQKKYKVSQKLLENFRISLISRTWQPPFSRWEMRGEKKENKKSRLKDASKKENSTLDISLYTCA